MHSSATEIACLLHIVTVCIGQPTVAAAAIDALNGGELTVSPLVSLHRFSFVLSSITIRWTTS